MFLKSFRSHLKGFATTVVLLSMFGWEGYGQTIDTPIVTGSPVCAASMVSVSFTVTNGKGQENDNGNGVGNGAEKYFSTSTNYTLELYENGLLISGATIIFNSATAPAPAGGATATIVKDFFIPADMVYGNQYQIKVSSENPSPTGNAGNRSSLTFEVHAEIKNNSIVGTQTGCNPYTSQILAGSLPTGGNNSYSYLWDSSTTGPDTGFAPAPGTNNGQNYDPGTLTQTTWFRRVVTSGACTNVSNVIKITVSNNNTWTGDIDTDWNTPGNWSCYAVPIPVTDVIIPSNLASNNYPVLNSGAIGTAHNLHIETAARLTITNNVLELGGSISNNGIFDTQNGSLKFVGATAQILPGNLLNNRISNLTVDNPAGLSLNGLVEVIGTVLAASGDITSSGNLKLISTATQTALIDGSGTGEVLGNVIMQRYLDVAYGYKYFSSPFKNTTVGDFTPFMNLADPVTHFPHFYSYDENRQSNGQDASGWVIDTLPGTALKVGHGYAVNFGSSGNSQLVELSGEMNNGQIDLNLPNNNGNYTKGFHLLGNPYPSPIDWNNVTRTNVEDALYFFTAGSTDPYTGTYSSFVNGVSSGVQNTSNIISSMQGFFVKVLDGATNGTVSFQNSARVNDFTQDFLKKPKSVKPDTPLVRLKAGFISGKKDALVIYFPQDGKPGFEEDKDAQKLFNTDPNVPSFYSILKNEQKLSINALSISEAQIPLGIKAERSGEMNISLQSVQNLATGRVIYLMDKETGMETNLSERNTYRFRINHGEHNNRFQLIFSQEKLTDEEAETFNPLSLHTYKTGFMAEVKLKLTDEGVLQITNLNGQILKRRPVKGEERIEFIEFPTQGVYVVSLFYQGKVYSKKVIVQ